MRVERVRPAVLQVTVHAYELAALVSAARAVVEGAAGGVPDEAREQLREVLADYDREVAALRSAAG